MTVNWNHVAQWAFMCAIWLYFGWGCSFIYPPPYVFRRWMTMGVQLYPVLPNKTTGEVVP